MREVHAGERAGAQVFVAVDCVDTMSVKVLTMQYHGTLAASEVQGLEMSSGVFIPLSNSRW